MSYAEKSRVDELDTAIATLVNLPSAQPDNDRIWSALSKVYNMDGVPDAAKSIIGDVMLGLDEPSTQPDPCNGCSYLDVSCVGEGCGKLAEQKEDETNQWIK